MTKTEQKKAELNKLMSRLHAANEEFDAASKRLKKIYAEIDKAMDELKDLDPQAYEELIP